MISLTEADSTSSSVASDASHFLAFLAKASWQAIEDNDDMRKHCLMGMADVPENMASHSGSPEDFWYTNSQPVDDLLSTYLARDEFEALLEASGIAFDDIFNRFDRTEDGEWKSFIFCRGSLLEDLGASLFDQAA